MNKINTDLIKDLIISIKKMILYGQMENLQDLKKYINKELTQKKKF